MGFFGCSAAGWGEAAAAFAARPELTGLEVGCEWRAVTADETAGTARDVFEAELDGEEALVSAGGLDAAGGFVCGSAVP